MGFPVPNTGRNPFAVDYRGMHEGRTR
jgi:hypothetical protein